MNAHKNDTLVNTPKITFGMIVLNGEPFIGYNLRALYPYAYQIIVVEGAALSAKSIATPDGHSTDNTRETIRKFQEKEDIEHKVALITAEDEGYPNGFWSGEKDEMSQAYAKRATGDYLWQIDVDEFYLQQDMDRIIEMVVEDPSISAVTFPMRTFWGAPQYLVDGFFLRTFVVHRLFRWAPGFRYITHRPPTVADENGTDLRMKNHISAKEMAKRGIYLYHYELLFPKQVMGKCRYYRDAEWITSLRELDAWVRNSYENLHMTFRPHMMFHHISWLERFDGAQPQAVVDMVDAVKVGNHPGISMRQNNDVEELLAKSWYRTARWALKATVPVYHRLQSCKNSILGALRYTTFWKLLR